jgi:hypothetical protein
VCDPAAGAVPPGIAKSEGRIVSARMNDPQETKLDWVLSGKRVNML